MYWRRDCPTVRITTPAATKAPVKKKKLRVAEKHIEKERLDLLHWGDDDLFCTTPFCPGGIDDKNFATKGNKGQWKCLGQWWNCVDNNDAFAR
eukprot:NODE_5549_length_401_cov_512.025568_g4019_i3.p2 GENE.NODE_5549_length_401_cov_512.025568_g4019_i3~~NODE_5549_length_401_cov_512.025568_g4019_i3.p2  ORF type:complete len:93 (-),score=27.10 NODE_5549_length_401_cov_512.025568_g4019_i3:70-348(-)